MELRRLRYFLALADELHFGRAAARLNMAQPPLSEQIRKLEEELQAVLFQRSSRNVALTEAGRIFLNGARRAVEEVDRAAHAAQQADRGMRGHLVIGFVSSASITLIPELLRKLREQISDFQPELRQYSSAESLSALKRHAIDIGFLRTPILDDELSVQVIVRDRVMIAVPDGHRLAAEKEVRLAELRDELFILFPPHQGSAVNSVIQQVCLEAGFVPRPAQFVQDVYAMLGLVGAGLGVALVPDSLAKLNVAGVSFRMLVDVKACFDLSIAWHSKDQRPLVKNVVGQIVSSLQRRAVPDFPGRKVMTKRRVR